MRLLRWARSVDLRFSHKEREAQFLHDQIPKLVRNGTILTTISLVACFAVWAPIFWSESQRQDNPFRLDAADPRTFVFFMLLALCASTIIFLGPVVLRHKGFKTAWPWERLFMLPATLISSLHHFTDFWYVPLLYGLNPEGFWGVSDVRDSEMRGCITSIMQITAICMFMPIRVHVIWVVAAGSWVSYACFNMFMPSPFPDSSLANVGKFLILAVIACWSHYQQEKQIREKWVAQQDVLKSQGNMALLRGTHDIIIKLRQNLTITDSSAREASFLGQDMEGKLFTDLLSQQDDRDRFLKLLEQVASQETQIPLSIQVSLVRNIGPMDVTLMVVSTGLQDPLYLIGIQSLAEEAVEPADIAPAFAAEASGEKGGGLEADLNPTTHATTRSELFSLSRTTPSSFPHQISQQTNLNSHSDMLSGFTAFSDNHHLSGQISGVIQRQDAQVQTNSCVCESRLVETDLKWGKDGFEYHDTPTRPPPLPRFTPAGSDASSRSKRRHARGSSEQRSGRNVVAKDDIEGSNELNEKSECLDSEFTDLKHQVMSLCWLVQHWSLKRDQAR